FPSHSRERHLRLWLWLDSGGRSNHRRNHWGHRLQSFLDLASAVLICILVYPPMKHLLALDQGTTSSRALIIEYDGKVTAVAQKEFTQIFPQPGWVEHNPKEIWASQIAVAAQALGLAEMQPRDIAGIGITNQRETTLVWDR